MPERPVIVFDVNETLPDLQAIRPALDRIFSDPAAMRLWFAGLITYSEALTLAGVYVPFTGIGGELLRMLTAARGITISGLRAVLPVRSPTRPGRTAMPSVARPPGTKGDRVHEMPDLARVVRDRIRRGARIDRPEHAA